MSLAIAFKGPEGIVLAADSRITLTTTYPNGQQVSSHFDNATKVLWLEGEEHQHIGIVTYGAGAIGLTAPRTAHSFIPEFEAQLSSGKRLSVSEMAVEVGKFYADQWQQAKMPPGIDPMVFLVAGFDEGEAYGRVYEVVVPSAVAPVERAPGPDEFGLTFGGQAELVARLMGGVDPRAVAIAQANLSLAQPQADALAKEWVTGLALPIPYQFLPLQDCVDLSSFLVYMTTMVQSWTVGVRGVGGAVDVATITRTDGFRAVKQKTIEAWR
jgi:hypothetical protein